MKLHEITGSKFIKNKVVIDNILCNFINNYTVNADFSVDVHESISLDNVIKETLDFDKIKFNHVDGSFHCSKNSLTDLDFAPIRCTKFFCNSNLLTSLEGMPECVQLSAWGNQLTSFKGIKQGLISISISGNPIKSLVGISDDLKIMASGTIIMSFNLIKEGGLGLVLVDGLSVIRNSVSTSNLPEPFQIINKYLGTDDIIECQSELIEAGFEEYAQL